jgi:hypothetical protein
LFKTSSGVDFAFCCGDHIPSKKGAMSSSVKKSTLVLVYLAMAILLITTPACEGITPEGQPPQATLPPQSLTAHEGVTRKAFSQPAPTATPGPTGSAQSNPAPFGTPVSINNMTLKVTGLIRPADDLVAQGNMFNAAPEAGKEYVFVNLSATCNRNANETCQINDFDFQIVGSSGQSQDAEIFLAGVSGLLEDGDFDGGTTKTGSVAFIVEKSETNLILIYAPFLGDEAYLSAEQ